MLLVLYATSIPPFTQMEIMYFYYIVNKSKLLIDGRNLLMSCSTRSLLVSAPLLAQVALHTREREPRAMRIKSNSRLHNYLMRTLLSLSWNLYNKNIKRAILPKMIIIATQAGMARMDRHFDCEEIKQQHERQLIIY